MEIETSARTAVGVSPPRSSKKKEKFLELESLYEPKYFVSPKWQIFQEKVKTTDVYEFFYRLLETQL